MDSSDFNAMLINDDSYIPGSDFKSKNNEKALWSSINFTLALAAFIIALSGIILGLVTYIQLHDHFVRTKETVICNTGNNDGLDLPLCGQKGIAPGLPILFGKDEKILGRRFTKGLGVQLESFDDSHIQVGVLVESLSPSLSVGKKLTSHGESITFNITEREETPNAPPGARLCDIGSACSGSDVNITDDYASVYLILQKRGGLDEWYIVSKQ